MATLQTGQKNFVREAVNEYGKSSRIIILIDELQHAMQIMPFGSKQGNRLYDQFCLVSGRRFILYQPW